MSDSYKNSIIIKNILRNYDSRGSILSLVYTYINNISIITSIKNTIKSNHYHIKD